MRPKEKITHYIVFNDGIRLDKKIITLKKIKKFTKESKCGTSFMSVNL